MILYMYTVIARALKATHAHLTKNSNNFRALIKASKAKLKSDAGIAKKTVTTDGKVNDSPTLRNLNKPAQQDKIL